MVLYLRIVHSIDYYSANEYPNEDEMPHRCGIMHARGVPPSTKVTKKDCKFKDVSVLAKVIDKSLEKKCPCCYKILVVGLAS